MKIIFLKRTLLYYTFYCAINSDTSHDVIQHMLPLLWATGVLLSF